MNSLIKVVNDTIHVAKVVLYKDLNNKRLYLLVKEPEDMWGFPGGAQDIDESSLFETAKRELFEELCITDKSYTLIATQISHEFVFTDPQSDRYNKKGVLHMFLSQYNGLEEIQLEKKLRGYEWVTEDQAIKKLNNSYPYLKNIFQKTISNLPASNI